jgi:methylthioxylose transferase
VIFIPTRASRSADRSLEAAIPRAGLILAALTVLTGLGIKDATNGLGTALPPFVMFWGPDVDPLLAVALVVSVGAAAFTPLLITRVRRPAVFAAAAFALALALGLSLNLARTGVGGWTAVFTAGVHGSREAHNEYLPGLPALAHGVGYYLQHFPVLLPHLPVHVQGNPPGPLIALHLLGIDTPAGLTALCVGLGALTAPLAYDLGRVLGGEERGRLTALLTAFAPSLLLFGVTSADFAFTALGLCAACLLVRRNPVARLGGGAAAAAGSFFCWLLVAIPVWAAIVVFRREGARRALACAALSALFVVGLNVGLALAVGYDPLATLRTLDQIYRHGIASTRPYAYWVFGSPVAWALMLGLPTAWLALRSLGRGDPAAVALAAIVVLSAVLGLTKAETERIWLPFVPLAAVAASAVLSPQRMCGTLWLLVAQALAVELLFGTTW